MIIVKLGGSVITDKSKYRSFRRTSCYNILKAVKDLNTKFIVIHGGGSFGHIMASELGLPGKKTDKTLLGFAEVHADMVDLNQKIISILSELSIPSVPIPPAVIYVDGKLFMDPFHFYSDMGIVPVTFGDTYLTENKVGIISGDDLAIKLAEELSPERVIFFSDVDGIYNKNPKIHKDAFLLKRLNDNATYEITGKDVTGGMEAKVRAALKIAQMGTKVYMINGRFPERIGMLESENFIGTVIG